MSRRPNEPQTGNTAGGAVPAPGADCAVSGLSVRPIVAADAPLVAALQAASWRSLYRGLLSDDYLAHTLEGERRAVWEQRLAGDDARHLGLVAVRDSVVVGFAFAIAAADRRYGSLLDNLHVSAELRGLGIGRLLLSELAREIQARRWETGLFLWVFEVNAGARRFYERYGAVPVEVSLRDTPGGGVARGWRYAWPDATALILPPAGPTAHGS